ncbi:hypothetical protein PFHG_04618 [Plasmodium falciparum HB3]|uniref:Uncharacterized protein n=1 Tax=Plasmodium falciparum (isolate HB3) TaxID=137071 RepID=A0A0L7KHV3_PLAFX|nr:hypothetical protein PFHG_04618 [Plasmodium falciparum HB3]
MLLQNKRFLICDTRPYIGNSFIATDFFDRWGRYLYATERFNEIFGIPSKDVREE